MDGRDFCPFCMQRQNGGSGFCTHCGRPLDYENEAHQLAVGTVLRERYQLGSVLGEGGFGITYIGYDLLLQIPVAIKEYYPFGAATRHHAMESAVTVTASERERFETGLSRFLDEARSLARFSHERSIVNVRDYFTANSTAYIVMEYLDGESLSRVAAERGPFSYERAVRLLLPVVEALGRVHAGGLIHRDISPDNLMLMPDGSVKLLDFGTARAADGMGERSRSVVLKPGYAPEEQYRRHGAQGPWTDVYALCATIYHLITGQMPENSMERLFEDRLTPPSALGAHIAPFQEKALLQGMAVNAADRPQSMTALRTMLLDTLPREVPSAEHSGGVRTVYGPEEQEEAAAAPDVPVYVPERKSEELPSMFDEPEPAPEPWTEPAPEHQPATEPESEPEPEPEPEKKPKRERPAKQKKTHRQKKQSRLKLILLIAGGVLALAVIAYVGLALKNSHDHTTHVTFEEEEITAKQLENVERQSQITYVYFVRCTVSDEMIEQLGRSSHINHVNFYQCTGFTTLAPLANGLVTILDLTRSDSAEERLTLDGTAMFPTDFSAVIDLRVGGYRLSDDGAFLSKFPNLQYLIISDCDASLDLRALSNAEKLRSLSISGTEVRDADYSPLSGCTKLSRVTLDEEGVRDLLWLTEMEELSTLYVRGNELTTLAGLENKPKLMYLYASENRITDISALSGDEKLYSADLSQNEIEDLSPLAGCMELETLLLSGNRISDASPLAGCTQLSKLSLEDNLLEDLDFCEQMIRLTSVRAGRNRLQNIRGLANSTQITELWIDGNEITDLSPLSDYTKLDSLKAADNRIADLSPLSGSTELRLLTAENNALTSLNGLQGVKLQQLTAGGNEITDISALAGCDTLLSLELSHNRITDISALENMNSLSYLDLGDNQISEIGALYHCRSSKQALILSNNNIRDITPLPLETEFLILSLYGNPISDFSHLQEIRIVRNTRLCVSWAEDWDFTPIGAGPSHNISLVDVPLNRRADVLAQHEELKDNMFAPDPEFLTAAEADEKTEELREEVRKQETTAAIAAHISNYFR